MKTIDTKALRMKILDLAMSGKLVPQDPNDESVEVLLERIKVERESLVKQKKIKKVPDYIIYKGDDNRYYEKIENKEVDVDIQVSIANEIWKPIKLGDLLYLRTGASFAKEIATTVKKPEYIRVLRGGNIQPLKYSLKADDLYIPMSLVNDNIILQDNDLITPAVTSLDNVGKVARISHIDETITAGGFVFILSPLINEECFSKFLLYLISSNKFQCYLKSITKKSGSAFYNVNKEKLASSIIFLPSLSEQSRIVDKIEQLFSIIDDIENRQNTFSSLQQQLISKVLSLAIQGKLVPQDKNDEPASELLKRIRAEKKAQLGKKYVESFIFKGDDNYYYEKKQKVIESIDETLPFEISNSWEWVRLGEIGDWGAGATPQRGNPEYYNNGTIPWLKTGELNNDYIYDSEEKISEIALEKCSLRYNQIGDILIAMYGATIGKLGIVGKPLTTNQACCACTPHAGIYNEYLFYLLMANKDNFIKMGFGGAQPNISREKIINFLAPIPPLAEQHRIVKKLKEVLDFMSKGEN